MTCNQVSARGPTGELLTQCPLSASEWHQSVTTNCLNIFCRLVSKQHIQTAVHCHLGTRSEKIPVRLSPYEVEVRRKSFVGSCLEFVYAS